MGFGKKAVVKDQFYINFNMMFLQDISNNSIFRKLKIRNNMETIYTAKTKTTGGRKGHAKSIDGGPIDMNLSVPKAMGGDGGDGANPEQFFAAAYSACFGGAVELVAGQHDVKLEDNFFVEAHVSIGKTDKGNLLLSVILDTYMPKVNDRELAEKIINKAHKICPFSRATRDNIDVTLNLLLDEK